MRQISSAARWLVVAVAAGAIALATAIVVTGGFHLQALGLRISVTDPTRPLLVAAGAAVFGLWRWRDDVRNVASLAAEMRVRQAPMLAALIAIAVFGTALLLGSTVGASADAYGYVSQAALWRHATLIFPIAMIRDAPWPNAAWTFAALGYRPAAAVPDAIVPTYAPGLPILMAVAQSIVGYAGAFLIVPASAALTVWLTFVFGRRVFGAGLGLWAALLVATSPAFLMQSMSPMSDVPVAAAWTAALVLATAEQPLAAGVAGAATLAIRPNLVLLPVALALWLFVSAVDAGGSMAIRLRRVLMFGIGLVPGIALIALVNQHLYGSPLSSGYGATSGLYSVDVFPTNVARYGTWLLETQTPAVLLGAVALLAPRWTVASSVSFPRLLLGGTIAATLASYLFYFAFTDWWYLRFLLPMWPAMMLLVAAGIDGILRRWTPRLRPLGLVVVVALLAWQSIGIAASRQAFTIGRGEERYVDLAKFVAARTEPDAVIICMQHSGSLRQYAGRLTLRIDWLDEGSLDRAAAYLSSVHRHPYIVLENWEVEQFQQRFSAKNRLGRLDWLPIAVLGRPNEVSLYDAADTRSVAEPIVIPAVGRNRRISWPVDPPSPTAIPFP